MSHAHRKPSPKREPTPKRAVQRSRALAAARKARETDPHIAALYDAFAPPPGSRVR